MFLSESALQDLRRKPRSEIELISEAMELNEKLHQMEMDQIRREHAFRMNNDMVGLQESTQIFLEGVKDTLGKILSNVKERGASLKSKIAKFTDKIKVMNVDKIQYNSNAPAVTHNTKLDAYFNRINKFLSQDVNVDSVTGADSANIAGIEIDEGAYQEKQIKPTVFRAAVDVGKSRKELKAASKKIDKIVKEANKVAKKLNSDEEGSNRRAKISYLQSQISNTSKAINIVMYDSITVLAHMRRNKLEFDEEETVAESYDFWYQ